jgi:D-amino peptidase
MTKEVNAAIAGAFEGGATNVLVTDGHWDGLNIMVEELDPRARLNSGLNAPLAMLQGMEQDIDAACFIGYHAQMGTLHATLDHTWASRKIASVWLNDRLTGETGLNAALCGHYDVPVLFVSGDKTLEAEATDWIPEVATLAVKNATSRQSAECLSTKTSFDLIQQSVRSAVINFQKGLSPEPLKLNCPVTLRTQFQTTALADEAQIYPGSIRRSATTVEVTCPDMRFAYLAFQSLVSLAI